MPSSFVHRYIGLDTLNRLNDKPKAIITKRVNNYIVYCQYTDPLYFYHILIHKNKVIELGHILHRENVYRNLSYLINANKQNKDDELFTLISGFITHYKADSICHPYINYLAYNDDDLLRTDKHFEIETYLDNYYLNKREKMIYNQDNNTSLIFNYHKEPIVIETINNLFKEYYNVNNMGKKYYSSLRQMKFVFNYIRHDKYGIKRKIYRLLDKNKFRVRRTEYLSYNFPLDNDEYYLNNKHREWYNVRLKNIKRYESFPDLYHQVVKESIYIINELYEYIYNNKELNLRELIGNYSLANGLELKGQ